MDYEIHDYILMLSNVFVYKLEEHTNNNVTKETGKYFVDLLLSANQHTDVTK